MNQSEAVNFPKIDIFETRKDREKWFRFLSSAELAIEAPGQNFIALSRINRCRAEKMHLTEYFKVRPKQLYDLLLKAEQRMTAEHSLTEMSLPNRVRFEIVEVVTPKMSRLFELLILKRLQHQLPLESDSNNIQLSKTDILRKLNTTIGRAAETFASLGYNLAVPDKLREIIFDETIKHVEELTGVKITLTA